MAGEFASICRAKSQKVIVLLIKLPKPKSNYWLKLHRKFRVLGIIFLNASSKEH